MIKTGSAWPRDWKTHLAVFVVILATSKIGTLLLLTRGTVVCPFWPESGVALYLTLTYGWRIWPGLWAGVLASDLLAGDSPLFITIDRWRRLSRRRRW